MKSYTMSKILHRLFHIPSIILLAVFSFIARTMIAIYDFWFMNKDSIKWHYNRIVRDIKCLIPQIISAVVGFAMCLPVVLAFGFLMIKLS